MTLIITDEKKGFILTSEHLTLLRNLNISFTPMEEIKTSDNLGVPVINAKRPYGSSDIYRDINKLLELGLVPNDEGEFSEKEKEFMLELHRSMGDVLQIVLSTGSFESGIYEAKAIVPGRTYSDRWENIRHPHFDNDYVILDGHRTLHEA